LSSKEKRLQMLDLPGSVENTLYVALLYQKFTLNGVCYWFPADIQQAELLSVLRAITI